ncbi:Gfo/Idh/MocA family protein [Corynebacterium glyciniphilum]|uniref:Gfo/Idh/MocA family protein n=1 Tax=Corynebacterium glyciniphilum TaxID=1404244 RepID=UPI003FD32EE7
MKKLTLGLVGVGRIGKMHATNLLDVRRQVAERDIELDIVLADAFPDAARQAADELGLRAADSVDSMIAEGIDGLMIATSTATHPDLIRKGLAAGLPMFCEKPVSSSVPDALPILREIEEAQGIVQIGHQRRFDAGYKEAKRRLQDGELGWLHCLKAVSGDAFPPPVSYCATSGGLFRDVAVHDFDIIRWLTGQEVTEVFARGSNNGDPEIGNVGDIDTSVAVLTLADGTLATAAATRYNGAGHDIRLDVMGSKASAIVGLDDKSALKSAEADVVFPSQEAHPTFAERFLDAYKSEFVAFIELILGERENPCTPFDAVSAAAVSDAAQLSLVTGQPVKVPSLRAILDGQEEPLEVVELQPKDAVTAH